MLLFFDNISILLIGFSVCASLILLICYLWFINSLNKTPTLNISCIILLFSFCYLQFEHLRYFLNDVQPMSQRPYMFFLFLAPPTFYIFFRALLKQEQQFHPLLLLNYLLFVISFFVRREITMPLLFMTGTAYSVWLAIMVYGLKDQRKQFKIEISFLVLFSILAVGVLLLGIAIPYMDARYFYYFYTFAIGIALALTTGALIVNADLPGEISEIAKSRYTASTLTGVDIEEKLKLIDSLMTEKKLYQDESLNLASMASETGLSGHQLSELINTKIGLSFSQYMRSTRVDAAKRSLLEEPNASVLAIGLDNGFKSQSSFYAAFKELTGISPGAYRDKQTKKVS